MLKLSWSKPKQVYSNDATKIVSILEATDETGLRVFEADICLIMQSCPCCSDIQSFHIQAGNSVLTWEAQTKDQQNSLEATKYLAVKMSAFQHQIQKCFDENQ